MEWFPRGVLRRLVTFILSTLIIFNWEGLVSGELYANQWAVYMEGGLELANKVALDHGFRNMGRVSMPCFIPIVYGEPLLYLNNTLFQRYIFLHNHGVISRNNYLFFIRYIYRPKWSFI